MPIFRKYIPFRGDNDSKEEAKRHLGLRQIPPVERFLLWAGIIIFLIIMFFSTGVGYKWSKEFFIGWLIIFLVSTSFIYFMHKDADNISKRKKDNDIDQEDVKLRD
ncbi:MAG: hypothetical protein RIR73_1517 [Chloroflexota bacterium]|jgi:amino acid permease